MIRRFFFLCSVFLVGIVASHSLRAQHTISIIALDTITRELGVAAMSCTDLYASAVGPHPFFVSAAYPDKGIGVCQAQYNSNNYNDLKSLLPLETPDNTIAYLLNNNSTGDGFDTTHRQYAVVGYLNGEPDAKAFTGSNCDVGGTFFGHRTGRNYSIQVNSAAGPAIIDSMQARFLRKTGNLACKLMYALHGANFPGADPRCSGVPGLYASLRVCRPQDLPDVYYIELSVMTHTNQGVQVIDSLQRIADFIDICSKVWDVGVNELDLGNQLNLYPNPSTELVYISNQSPYETESFILRNMIGQLLLELKPVPVEGIDISLFDPGLYVAEIGLSNGYRHDLKFVKRR